MPHGDGDAAGASHRYDLRPLTTADLPLIRRWLAAPHVVEWWGDADEQYALISGDVAEPRVEQVVLLLDGRPVGYAQTWAPHDWPGHPFLDQPPGTRGVDPFIGDVDCVGRGHGAGFLRQIADRLLASGASRVMIDPDPANLRAVRAYARAGFRAIDERMTDDGPALLMIREPIVPK